MGVGRKEKLYVNTNTHASPTWLEVKFAQDVSCNPTKDKVEQNDRSSPYKKKIGGGKELALQFGYTKQKGTDAIYAIFLDSYVNDTPVELACMDGDITVAGAKGWRAYYEVFGLEESGERDGLATYDVDAELTFYEEASVVIDPDHYVIT